MKKIYGKSFNLEGLNRNAQWKKDIALEQEILSKEQKPITVEISKCPICSSSRNKIFCTIFEYDYLKCSSCEHLFCKFVASQEKIEEFYSSTKDIKSAQAKVYIDKEIFNKRVNLIAIPKVNFVNDNIKHDEEKKTWVDIGAGVGELVYASKKNGWNSIGFDVDIDSIKFAKDNDINVNEGLLNDSFDYSIFENATVVSFINVLEHVRDPSDLVLKVSKYIPKNSYLLIEVPRHPSLSSFLNYFFPQNSNRHIYPPDHLHIFSDNSMELMLSNYGFEIQVGWFFGQDFSDLFANLLLTSPLEDDDFFGIQSLTGELQSIIDNNDYSDTMLVLAKKN